MKEAFAKADDTLSIAAKSISEIITYNGYINLDFQDVQTTLKDGGVAIISTGYGEGEGRVKQALYDALNSPLLNNNDIFNSEKILSNLAYNEDDSEDMEFMMNEMDDIDDFMAKFHRRFHYKWGMSNISELGSKVKITILASGFGMKDVDGMEGRMAKINQEEAIAAAQIEEENRKREERRDGYYGADTPRTKRKKHPNIYLFRPEDLDNEDVIIAVEDSPTYSRSQQKLEEIRKSAGGKRKQPTEEPEQPLTQGTISFA